MMSSSIVAEPIATSTWQGTCRWAADYLALTKPCVVLMVLITTFVGFYLSSPGHLYWIIDLASRKQQFLAKLAAHCLASFPGGKGYEVVPKPGILETEGAEVRMQPNLR